MAHHARRAEEHLGVDAVDVLLLEARLAAEVPWFAGGERHARPADVLVLAAGRRVDADRRRRDVGRELPGLAALAVGARRAGPSSWNFFGMYVVQMCGGSSTCESAEMSW